MLLALFVLSSIYLFLKMSILFVLNFLNPFLFLFFIPIACCDSIIVVLDFFKSVVQRKVVWELVHPFFFSCSNYCSLLYILIQILFFLRLHEIMELSITFSKFTTNQAQLLNQLFNPYHFFSV